MRILLCLAFVSTTVFASPLPSLGDAGKLQQDIAGEYRLDNGRNVRLTLVDDRLYLDLNRSLRRELLPTGDGRLASRDGKLTVAYLPEGPVERILIAHPGIAAERLGESSWIGR